MAQQPIVIPDQEEGWEELLESKARFCLVTGIAPSEYDEMTEDEVEIYVRVYNDLHPESD